MIQESRQPQGHPSLLLPGRPHVGLGLGLGLSPLDTTRAVEHQCQVSAFISPNHLDQGRPFPLGGFVDRPAGRVKEGIVHRFHHERGHRHTLKVIHAR